MEEFLIDHKLRYCDFATASGTSWKRNDDILERRNTSHEPTEISWAGHCLASRNILSVTVSALIPHKTGGEALAMAMKNTFKD